MLLGPLAKGRRDRVPSPEDGATGAGVGDEATGAATGRVPSSPESGVDVHTISDESSEEELPAPKSTGSAAVNATKQPPSSSLLSQLLAGNSSQVTRSNGTGSSSEAAKVSPGKMNVSQPLRKFVLGQDSLAPSPLSPSPLQHTALANPQRTSPGQLLRNSPGQRHRTSPSQRNRMSPSQRLGTSPGQRHQTSPHRRNLFKVPDSPAVGNRGGRGGRGSRGGRGETGGTGGRGGTGDVSGNGNRVKGGSGKTTNAVVGKKAAALKVQIRTHSRTQPGTGAAAKTTVTQHGLSRSQSPRPGTSAGGTDNRERRGVLENGAEPPNVVRYSAAHYDDDGSANLAAQIDACRDIYPEEQSLFDDNETSLPGAANGRFRVNDGEFGGSRDSLETDNRRSSDRDSGHSSDSSQSSTHNWSDPDTYELIKRFAERTEAYQNNTTPKHRIWKEIARFVPPHTAKACDSKWKYLVAQYTTIRSNQGDTETGQAPAREFKFFDELDEILRNLPSQDPVMRCDSSWSPSRNIPPSYLAASSEEEYVDDPAASDRDSETESASASDRTGRGNRHGNTRRAPLNTVEINAARAADRERRALHMDRKEEFFKSTLTQLDIGNKLLEKIFEKL